MFIKMAVKTYLRKQWHKKHAAAYRPIPRAHECHHRHSSPTANLGQKTIAIVFCPRLAVAHLQFIEDLRSHLGKSSRKYRWPHRKCLEEIYKRSKGKQKVIQPRSNVLQQLFWTIYLTWLSLDGLVITLRSRFLSLKFFPTARVFLVNIIS